MEQLEDKVRLLKLQEEKAILMRKDVVIEEKLCDVKVCFALSLIVRRCFLSFLPLLHMYLIV